MAASGKKTKKAHENINNRLAPVMKSRKYSLGYKTVLKTLRTSKGVKAGCFLVDSKCLRSSLIDPPTEALWVLEVVPFGCKGSLSGAGCVCECSCVCRG